MITTPKTLNQWVSDGGNLWAVTFGPADTEPEILQGVKDAIVDYYGERHIGVMSDTRFQSLWNTALRKYNYPFWQMLKQETGFIEATNMLQTYKRTLNSELAIKQNQNQDETTNGTNKTTGTVGTDTTVSGSDKTTYGRTDNTTNNSTDIAETSGKGRNLTSDTPQSNVASSTSGLDTPVTWTYATGMVDTMSEETRSDTVNSTSQNTAGGSDTTETDSTNNSSTETDMTNTVNSTREATLTTNDTHTTTETETVDGNPYAEVLEKWKNYLFELPSALAWLLDRLEPLFYAFYD